MNRRVAALALGLSACAVGARKPGTPSPSTRTVIIEQFAFAPSELQLSVGDSVVWVNRDSFTHTTAADSAAWSSPELSAGDRFTFVATGSGRFPYHCEAHPVMRGTLVVR